MLIFIPGFPWRTRCTNKVFGGWLTLVHHGWKHRRGVPAEQTRRAALQVTFTATALSRNVQVPGKHERAGSTG